MIGTSASKGDKRTIVILIAGFSGSGKTTLLNRILSREKNLSDVVVIVNDFGKEKINGKLLETAGSGMVQLASGCICCTLRMDLQRTLEEVQARFAPKYVFIETSGIADPAAVMEVLDDKDLSEKMKVGRVITVLDVDLWKGREYFGPFFMNQLRQADLILLNKMDTVEEEILTRSLRDMQREFPETRIVPTTYCNMETSQ